MTTREEREAKIKRRARKAYKTRLLEHWYDQVPHEYQGFDLDDIFNDDWCGRLQPRTVRTKVKPYLANPSKFLILRGEEGRGKSSMGATLAAQIIWDLELSSLYKTTPILMDQFSFQGNENHIGQCIEPGLLFLDDVGARTESTTDHQKRCMWSVINERYGRERLTIITTNMPINSNSQGIGLSEWFGKSAWSRVAQDATVIEFMGDSFR